MVCRATAGVSKDGRGSNGGVWEWTSTVFEQHDGFVQSKLYPGLVRSLYRVMCCQLILRFRYSTDFYDTHHQVVVSSSVARRDAFSELKLL